MREFDNTICDKEGVPELIQSIIYIYGDMSFIVRLFNGRQVKFLAEHACPSIGLMDEPTRMQMLEAQNTIEKYILRNFSPYARARIRLV